MNLFKTRLHIAQPHVMFLVSRANEGKTEDSIELLALRLS